HLDRRVAVDGDQRRHAGDHNDERERQLAGGVRAQAGQGEELDAGLGGDHDADREPADGQEQRQERADLDPGRAEDALGERDLGQPGARPGVAEQAEDDRAGDGAQHRGRQAVPHAEAEEAGGQPGGQQAGVVDERASPEEGQLPGAAVPLAGGDGLDAVLLDPEELVAGGRPYGARLSGTHFFFPPLALPRSGFLRSAAWRPSQPHVELPRSHSIVPDQGWSGWATAPVWHWRATVAGAPSPPTRAGARRRSARGWH